MVPSTGESISRAPAASTTGASSRAVIGCNVLISMNSLPRTSPERNPSLPRKMLRTPLSSVMIEITVLSAPSATARGCAATVMPLSAAAFIATASRSQPITSKPRSASRAWMARPMRPRPTRPIFIGGYVRPVAFWAAVKWP